MKRSPWSELTGKQVTSWSGFALLLPYSFVGIFLANPDVRRGSIGLRLVAALAAQALLFALLWGWRLAARRWPRMAAGPLRVVLAFALASAVRGVLLALAFGALQVTPGIDWSRRLVGGVIGFTAALSIIDVAIGSVRQHRQRVALLQRRQAAALAARESTLLEMREQRDALAVTIRAEFLQRIGMLTESDAAAAIRQLKDTVNDLVRPISRQLAARPSWRPPPEPRAPELSFNAREFADDATRGRPLQPAWTALLFLCFGGPFLLYQLPTLYALQLLVAGAFIVWILTVGANGLLWLVQDRSVVTRVVLLVVGVLLAALLLAMSSVVLVRAPSDVLRRIILGDLILVPAVAFALVAARAARAQERSILSRLEASAYELDWASARSRCIQWRQQRSLARALHGPVQSAIGAAAIHLEQAVAEERDTRELLAATRSQLLAVIDQIDAEVGDPSPVETVLLEYAETWRGVCEVTWELDPRAHRALEADPIARFALTELAAEACWNAIRHVEAGTVAVRITLPHPRSLRMLVSDDGVMSGGDGPPGLGTQMLNDMTLHWSLERHSGMTVLEAEVPVQPLL